MPLGARGARGRVAKRGTRHRPSFASLDTRIMRGCPRPPGAPTAQQERILVASWPGSAPPPSHRRREGGSVPGRLTNKYRSHRARGSTGCGALMLAHLAWLTARTPQAPKGPAGADPSPRQGRARLSPPSHRRIGGACRALAAIEEDPLPQRPRELEEPGGRSHQERMMTKSPSRTFGPSNARNHERVRPASPASQGPGGSGSSSLSRPGPAIPPSHR
jgi:hypothetical protein